MSHARVGRNDRCPCGSGTKFKRCCLAPNALTSSPLMHGASASDRIMYSRMSYKVLSEWATVPQETLGGRTPIEMLGDTVGSHKIPLLVNDLFEHLSHRVANDVGVSVPKSAFEADLPD